MHKHQWVTLKPARECTFHSSYAQATHVCVCGATQYILASNPSLARVSE